MAHTQALRLLRYALRRAQYPLVGELLRFIIPPGEVDNAFSEPSTPQALSPTAGTTTEPEPAPGGAQPLTTAGSGVRDVTPFAEPSVQQSMPKSSWFGWLFGMGGSTAQASEAGSRAGSKAADAAVAATLAALDTQAGGPSGGRASSVGLADGVGRKSQELGRPGSLKGSPSKVSGR